MNSPTMTLHLAAASPRAVFRHAMRSLNRRHWRAALLLGAGLGLVNGISQALFSYSGVFEVLNVYLVGGLVLAALLLPSLAAAGALTPARVPDWVSFVAIGATATAVAYVLVFVVYASWVLGDTLEMKSMVARAWNFAPPFMMTGLFASLGYMHWCHATRRAETLRTLQIEGIRIARQAYEARLVALQARVEPRFLFETLSDIEALYDKDPTLGARVLDDLIVHLRTALPANEDTASSLAIEMALVRTWLDIMHVRSGGQLLFALPESTAPRDARMPPMILLPLVQHAAEAGGDNKCALLLSTGMESGRVRVTLVGPPTAFTPFNPSPAIAHIRERLDTLYGDQASLTLQAAQHDRSQAVLELPYERTDRRPR